MQKTILDKFIKEVVEQTEKIKIGDPLLEDTRMGPLINEPHLERVLGFIKSAKKQVRSEGKLGWKGRVMSWLLAPCPSLRLPWWLLSMMFCFGRVNAVCICSGYLLPCGTTYGVVCSIQKMPDFSFSLRVLPCSMVESRMYRRILN